MTSSLSSELIIYDTNSNNGNQTIESQSVSGSRPIQSKTRAAFNCIRRNVSHLASGTVERISSNSRMILTACLVGALAVPEVFFVSAIFLCGPDPDIQKSYCFSESTKNGKSFIPLDLVNNEAESNYILSAILYPLAVSIVTTTSLYVKRTCCQTQLPPATDIQLTNA